MKNDPHTTATRVETVLRDEGLELTMGGEPTFIPPNPEGPEWNHAAMGPEKLGYARRLSRRFLRTLYPGGLVMQVFGKQYPGEALPRWVVLTMQRRDGVPLWQEPSRLHLNDTPGKNKPGTARAFAFALAEKLGLGTHLLPCREARGRKTVAWVLPLDYSEGKWISDTWPWSRHNPVPLFPGDSPAGLRLPLGSLPQDGLRRAMTVAIVNGALEIFIPPLTWEPFQELIACCRDICRSQRRRHLIFCGYRPSGAGAFIHEIGAAADPGVLEVNLPPCHTWADYDTLLSRVDACARASGLVTHKLHLNGQIQGTGGGAHLIFGGPDLERNPFMRKPDLISSLIRYWQQHPSLAYFFTGQYVGPGSQAPRADETLLGKRHELETACLGVEDENHATDRAFLDRLFRNLMTDSGGNTHRAEICLDKFWNLASPNGQQGLVELRAFETTPDIRQQSLSALFIRALLAMLASRLNRKPLIDHGDRLHDTYMLPSALWKDIITMVDDLRQAGIPFEADWLRPIFEFRFPVLGEWKLPAGSIRLRQALEPWPLMAEVAEAGFTSRIVDNSTDRIEISLSSRKLASKVMVTVQGVALEFQDFDDTPAVGVRYKCANGWPALHPHIPVQSPLHIACFDRASGRCLHAAHYHFWNPDAPVYDGRPKDTKESIQRRRSRWRPCEASPGTLKTPRASTTSLAPGEHTLDLRLVQLRATN